MCTNIIGDTAKHTGALLYVCGTPENAKNVLDRVLNNPNKYDIYLTKGMTNLRLETVDDS